MRFSHTDHDGKARMVDVGDKPIQRRVAKAEGFIRLQPDTIKLINENQIKKGDVLTVAEIAGVQGAKRTSELIPLCHNILLTKIEIIATLIDTGVYVSSEVHCTGQTGVEMEALTGVNITLLTIYDMCKAVDQNMEIGDIKLISKTKTNIK